MLACEKVRRCLLVSAALLGGVLAGPGAASAASATHTVTYRGYRVQVPAGWAVYRLSSTSHVCVRFDRHAVYLGQPGSAQTCPAQPAGRTEAILVQPAPARADRTLAAPAVAAADAPGGTLAHVAIPADHVVVTATWRQHPAMVARALGVASLSRLAAASRVRPAVDHTALSHTARAHAAGVASAGAGQVYTGAGFDVCATPSSGAMGAWAGSYHAAGVYIGGANMACAQPNLTGAWVAAVSGAGWHLIPIYVGLQAPTNSCGCAGISATAAAGQGAGAASDAIAQAQARGLGAGNPIYFDMEAYPHTAANSAAVLTFLSAWTRQLHAAGYLSGVYGSDGSGIADLIAAIGKAAVTEPDAIWTANWNGSLTPSDPYVPAGDWGNHQRVHQYTGGHNETHGGVTLNIDSDYLDAPTAGAGQAVLAAAPPQNLRAPAISGAAVAEQTLTEERGGWSGAPSSYAVQWETCDGSGNNCVAVPGASGQTFLLTAENVGQTVRVIETAANSIGTGAPATSGATTPVQNPPGSGFWVFTAHGNVIQSANMAWYGSPARSGIASFTGVAPTADGQGYWAVDTAGRVLSYGDAATFGPISHRYPITGIVASPTGGYWLYTAHGNVYNVGTRWYGSAIHARVSTVTGMAATRDGRGYWLVDAAGRVFAYGDAAVEPTLRPRYAIRGIVGAPSGGYWLYTAHGNVYNTSGTAWYGSAARTRISTITGLTATADGEGYWLVDRAGRVLVYGDAQPEPAIKPRYPVIGITR